MGGWVFKKTHPFDQPCKNLLKCRTCDKVFESSCNRCRHERLHRAPTVKCGTCGKELKNQRCLKAHLKTHETGVNHKCRVCEKIFKTEFTRRQHERLHTAPTVKCETCGKKLKNRHSLRYHSKTHEP